MIVSVGHAAPIFKAENKSSCLLQNIVFNLDNVHTLCHKPEDNNMKISGGQYLKIVHDRFLPLSWLIVYNHYTLLL
jgi:hypothetical protein